MLKKRPLSQNYYTNRGNELRSRRALGNKFNIFKNIALKLCIVLFFGGIFYAILFMPVLAIKNVTVEGNKVISSIEIEDIIFTFAGQKKWKIFNNNILFFNSVDMESAISSRFGNIDTVKVEKKFPKTINVIIKEKPADISWCNKIKVEKVADEKKSSSDELSASEIPQCYLSDENGIIYEKIGDNVSADSIKVFRDEPIKIGIKICDDNLKNFIRKIFYDFNNKTGLSLAYLYIPPLESRELHLITSKNWKIYFDLNRGADEQIGDLSAFIKNELKTNDNKNTDYDYIDLRIVDRIIIKLKNESKM